MANTAHPSSSDDAAPSLTHPLTDFEPGSGWSTGWALTEADEVPVEVHTVRQLSVPEYEAMRSDIALMDSLGGEGLMAGIDRASQALLVTMSTGVQEWDESEGRFRAGSGRSLSTLTHSFSDRVYTLFADDGSPNLRNHPDLALLASSPRFAVAGPANDRHISVRNPSSQSDVRRLDEILSDLLGRCRSIWNQRLLTLAPELRSALVRLRRASADILDGTPCIVNVDRGLSINAGPVWIPLNVERATRIVTQLRRTTEPTTSQTQEESQNTSTQGAEEEAQWESDKGDPDTSAGRAHGAADSALLDLTMLIQSISHSTAAIERTWSASLTEAADQAADFQQSLGVFAAIIERLTFDLTEQFRAYGINPDLVEYPPTAEAVCQLLNSTDPDDIYQRQVTAKLRVLGMVMQTAQALREPSLTSKDPAGDIEHRFWDHGAFTALRFQLDSLSQCIVDEVRNASNGSELARRGTLGVKFTKNDDNTRFEFAIDTSPVAALNHTRRLAHFAWRVGDFAGCVFHLDRFLTLSSRDFGPIIGYVGSVTNGRTDADLRKQIAGFVRTSPAEESFAVHLSEEGLRLMDRTLRRVLQDDRAGDPNA